MRLRPLILSILFSAALISIIPLGFSQTPAAKPAAPAPTIAPATSSAPELQSTDLTLTSQSKGQTVSDDDINRFTNTIVLIKDFYVQPIGDKTLLDDAIRGMVSGLDPHSEYLDGDAYKTLLMTTSGEFGGVGIEVTPEYGILKIVTPMDDTPAAKAGIKPGDYIVAIDGKLVSEMTLQDAVDKMRGKQGSQVALTILRKGEKTPLTFKLNREIIRIASVKAKMLDGNFGYVRLTQFQEPTAKLMRDAILNLKNKNNGHLNGIILDLRNNPGGLLETAVQVVDSFLDTKKLNNKYNDVIVYTEGRLPEAQYSAKANGTDILNGAPIVVLINGGSASASEIVAGALQDYRRALIVGTTSFGKGSVQTVIPLDKTHALKLTTALYHTPSGKVIQNIGIIPDVQIEDLKIMQKKTDEDLAMIEPIKEYQLKNHLAGTSTNDPKAVEQNDLGLASDDFQLFEALKILRTMYRLNTMGSNS
ncbi:putative CtpA-like serine protease [Aquicella siphonis]|uniref:Putative CtpA-like serine protease n=1 Tax=Aquicella siphonis TaxID=254247 RepID=A0A5E4PDU6_9COXI|nr:S41 family peptidase [Aquicella siphonis]VVC75120.1 putative CtpA-like serine protease [Aquicella siphonis]